MAYSRNAIVKQAQSWIGCKESDGSHRKIIDIYNAHRPLARGYAVKYTDAWCATFVSAVSIKCGYTAIIPTECGCPNMIQLFQRLGEWQENDAYVPSPGDVIFYDWQDSGSGDNTGSPDHVGIVEKVSGNTITVIEGNKNDAVGRRTLQVNGRYIRGYGVPKYADNSSSATAATASSGMEKSVNEVAKEVLAGKWGNGDARRVKLSDAGYDYAQVQAAVNKLLKGSGATTKASAKAAETETAEPKTIWNYLMGKIGNAYGVAGLMGNLYAESGLVPNNLQNSYEKKLGYNDKTYTAAVDNGSYTKFSSDSAGYGLAQWTYSTRKKALKAYADAQNSSIGNLTMQIGFLMKELTESYPSVLKTLKSAKSILEASNAVLKNFERPADTGAGVQAKRAAYGQNYYDKYSGKTATGAAASADAYSSASPSAAKKPSYNVGDSYTLQVDLNVRTGAGTGYAKKTRAQLTADGRKHANSAGVLLKGTQVTCQQIKTIGSNIWIKVPSGWLAAYYNGEIYIK